MLNILQSAEDGVLAFAAESKPYCIPFGYVYIDGTLYISMLPKGRKWEYYKKNKNVCFNVYNWTDDNTAWQSVVLEGKIEKVNDMDTIENVVKANIQKMGLDPVEHLKKRMEYYKKTEKSNKGVKIFKIEIDEMEGRKMKGIIK